jgi:L-ascorbate metabolism protein UlaG (beta-lactamase superfamily)
MRRSLSDSVAVTRVFNASALVELPGGTILTDPCFRPSRFMRPREDVGLTVDRLPPLAAILGGHGVPDHWQLGPLRAYPYRERTPVLVATAAMAGAARRAGFADVEVLAGGESRTVGDRLTVTSLPGERITGMATNHYMLSSVAGNVFVGTEARSVEPLRTATTALRVDVALLPIDGTRLFGRRLVMDATAAVQATRLLGAHTLVPIHYGFRGIPGILRCPSGPDDLGKLAADAGVAFRLAGPGERTIIALDPAGHRTPVAIR